MHLAYSALRTTGKRPGNNRAAARYRGYRAACEKHRETIARIQQYLPGWQPELRDSRSFNRLVIASDSVDNRPTGAH